MWKIEIKSLVHFKIVIIVVRWWFFKHFVLSQRHLMLKIVFSNFLLVYLERFLIKAIIEIVFRLVPILLPWLLQTWGIEIEKVDIWHLEPLCHLSIHWLIRWYVIWKLGQSYFIWCIHTSWSFLPCDLSWSISPNIFDMLKVFRRFHNLRWCNNLLSILVESLCLWIHYILLSCCVNTLSIVMIIHEYLRVWLFEFFRSTRHL